MIKIKVNVGNERPIIENFNLDLNKALVGSKCFNEDEVMIPAPYVGDDGDTYQEIIVGANTDNDDLNISTKLENFTFEAR